MKGKYIIWIVIILLGTSCTEKKDSSSAPKDSIQQNTKIDKVIPDAKGDSTRFAGEFVYDGSSLNDGSGYLYQKLTLKQNRDSVWGELFSAIYLAKSNGGGYTTPDIMATVKVSGPVGRTVLVLTPADLGDYIKNGKFVKDQFMNAFQQDAEGNYLLYFDVKGKDFYTQPSKADELEIVFEKQP